MSKTYRRNKGWKKDRRDVAFKKSNKFKHWNDVTGKHPIKDVNLIDSDVEQ